MPNDEDIQRVVKVLAEKFCPQKIVLFGSRAYGTPRPDSDADLMIILPFDCSSYGMTVEMLRAIRPWDGFDLHPRVPELIRGWYAAGAAFMKNVIDKGRVPYEAAA